MTVHHWCHNVVTSIVCCLSFRGASCSESDSTKYIHDQVNVNQLDSAESRLSQSAIAEQNDEHSGDVADNLELKESADVHVDVTTPFDSLNARVKVISHKNHGSSVSGKG